MRFRARIEGAVMKVILRVMLALTLAFALLAVSGCGLIAGRVVKSGVESATGVKVDESGGDVTVTGEDGSSMTSSSDGTLPDGFPTDVPVYKPGKITAGIVSDSSTGKGYMVGLETADAAGDVFAWYESEVPGAGWKVTTTMKTDDDGLISAEKGDQALTVAVTAGGGGSATTISITVGPKG
jgi:hypothetical protein